MEKRQNLDLKLLLELIPREKEEERGKTWFHSDPLPEGKDPSGEGWRFAGGSGRSEGGGVPGGWRRWRRRFGSLGRRGELE